MAVVVFASLNERVEEVAVLLMKRKSLLADISIVVNVCKHHSVIAQQQ
jgi:hypothetical protein